MIYPVAEAIKQQLFHLLKRPFWPVIGQCNPCPADHSLHLSSIAVDWEARPHSQYAVDGAVGFLVLFTISISS